MTLQRVPSPTSPVARFTVRHFGWGLLVAMTLGCGLDGDLLLRTTEQVAAGGAAGASGQGLAGAPAVRPSPFCELKFGRSWVGADAQSTGGPAYPLGLGMMSIWMGYEQNDVLNNAITEMLTALSPGGNASLQGTTPVLYAYLIPFKAKEWDGINKDCDPNATDKNICTVGAEWIRTNRDKLRTTYATYATQVANVWGVNRPIIWLFEPSFTDYIRQNQTNQLSLAELAAVALDLSSTIKARLPNALISHFMSPEIADFAEYFSHFDLSLVSMVNVTGGASSDYFYSRLSGVYPNSTYRSLREATGLPLFVDTGFNATDIGESGWLTSSPDVVNARIAEGVIAVQMDTGTSAMQARIDETAELLTPLNCGK